MLCRDMGVPEYLSGSESVFTPNGCSVVEAGGTMFNRWLEEEEEQWHLGQKLLSSCPAEFLCPISLDIMTEPVILVGRRPARCPCCAHTC